MRTATAIAQIPESAWQTIADYREDGEAQIAETTYNGKRMIVRRTRLIGPQAELWPDWRHFPFLTNRTEEITLVEAEHRQHAVVELTIRDLKDQALGHFPSGQFAANSAWTVIACIAHNLTRWTTVIGLPGQTVRAARTLRRRLLQIPGRLTRTGPPVDAAPTRPLALATRLHPRACPDTHTAGPHLTDDPAPPQASRPPADAGAVTRARKHPKTTPRKRPRAASAAGDYEISQSRPHPNRIRRTHTVTRWI